MSGEIGENHEMPPGVSLRGNDRLITLTTSNNNNENTQARPAPHSASTPPDSKSNEAGNIEQEADANERETAEETKPLRSTNGDRSQTRPQVAQRLPPIPLDSGGILDGLAAARAEREQRSHLANVPILPTPQNARRSKEIFQRAEQLLRGHIPFVQAPQLPEPHVKNDTADVNDTADEKKAKKPKKPRRPASIGRKVWKHMSTVDKETAAAKEQARRAEAEHADNASNAPTIDEPVSGLLALQRMTEAKNAKLAKHDMEQKTIRVAQVTRHANLKNRSHKKWESLPVDWATDSSTREPESLDNSPVGPFEVGCPICGGPCPVCGDYEGRQDGYASVDDC